MRNVREALPKALDSLEAALTKVNNILFAIKAGDNLFDKDEVSKKIALNELVLDEIRRLNELSLVN